EREKATYCCKIGGQPESYDFQQAQGEPPARDAISLITACRPRRVARPVGPLARLDISIRRAWALLYRLSGGCLALGQGQRVARLSRQAFGFREPELLAHDVRAERASRDRSADAAREPAPPIRPAPASSAHGKRARMWMGRVPSPFLLFPAAS